MGLAAIDGESDGDGGGTLGLAGAGGEDDGDGELVDVPHAARNNPTPADAAPSRNARRVIEGDAARARSSAAPSIGTSLRQRGR